MKHDVYVYGTGDDDEILTTWMVNNGKPSFVTPDVSGQVTDVDQIPETATGIFSTKPISSLPLTKIVPDDKCRKLYAERYGH